MLRVSVDKWVLRRVMDNEQLEDMIARIKDYPDHVTMEKDDREANQRVRIDDEKSEDDILNDDRVQLLLRPGG